MSDWQAGDLALCVRGGIVECPVCHGLHNGSHAPKVGTISEVVGVSRCGRECDPEYRDDCAFPVLLFAGAIGMSNRFRKVTPPAADEWDRETIALLNGNRVGEPA